MQSEIDSTALLIKQLETKYRKTQERLLGPDEKCVSDLVTQLQTLKSSLQQGRKLHASLCEERIRVSNSTTKKWNILFYNKTTEEI